MKNLIVTITLLFGSFAFGHGEDKLGPHKGFVRMPGAFHTELVPDGKSQFKIYLLDIEWKNPSVQNSKLEITINEKARSALVACESEADYYQCKLPEGFSLKKGKLMLKAVRENSPGADIAYDLPLSLSSGADAHSHKGHH